MKTILFVLASLLLSMVGPMAGSIDGGWTLLDSLPAWVGESEPTVEVWDPVEGQPIARVAWDEFAAFFKETPLDGVPPLTGAACSPPGGPVSLPVYCGPDIGRGHPPAHAGYPCFDGAAWVIYRHASAGSAFTSLQRGEQLSTPFCSTCPGACPVYDWQFVEMSSTLSPDVLVGFLADGCYSSEWLLHQDGFCPNSGFGEALLASRGLPDTFLQYWRAQGPGVARTYAFGDGPDVWMDVFLGLGPITCYDVPASVDRLGECPEPPI